MVWDLARRGSSVACGGPPVAGLTASRNQPGKRSDALAQRTVHGLQRATGDRAAVRQSARHVELLLQPRARSKAEQREGALLGVDASRSDQHPQACRLLGVSRRTGNSPSGLDAAIRPPRPLRSGVVGSGGICRCPERLQIADLLRLGCSDAPGGPPELGRSPSTVKRELDRHRDAKGRYLPQVADHAATQQRLPASGPQACRQPGAAPAGASASSTVAGHPTRSTAGCA